MAAEFGAKVTVESAGVAAEGAAAVVMAMSVVVAVALVAKATSAPSVLAAKMPERVGVATVFLPAAFVQILTLVARPAAVVPEYQATAPPLTNADAESVFKTIPACRTMGAPPATGTASRSTAAPFFT